MLLKLLIHLLINIYLSTCIIIILHIIFFPKEFRFTIKKTIPFVIAILSYFKKLEKIEGMDIPRRR